MASYGIYERMQEIIEEMKGDWKSLFESDNYGHHLRKYIENLVSGVYDSLRVEGARIPESLLETEMNRFRLERIFDPNSSVKTARCSSTENVFTITVNGACPFMKAVNTVEEKHEITVGLLIHEVGHRLFTDFRTAIAQDVQMRKYGKWFPIQPNGIQTPEGVILQQKLYGNPDYCATFADMIRKLSNCIEDGYIENEMKSHYPGLASSYLAATNSISRKLSDTLTSICEEENPSHLAMILSQWFEYAKYSELNLGERDKDSFEPEVMEMIYGGMDLIDEAVNMRDPRKRAEIINELAVMISPYVDEEIEKNDPKGSGSGGNESANQKVQKMLQQLAQNSNGGIPQNDGTGIDGKQNTSQSMTNPNRSSNSGLQNTVNKKQGSSSSSEKSGQDSGGQQGKDNSSSSGGSKDGGEIDHSAAENDLNNMLSNAAAQKAMEEMEQERTKDMQKEADSLSHELSGTVPKITRAATVSSSNEEAYNRQKSEVHNIAKRLAKILLKELKQYTDDDALPWQYSGNKFVSKQYCRNELKAFKRNTMPRPAPNLSIYVLCDESGSVTGELNNAEIATAVILEDFCRTTDIPLCIQGYTSSRSKCEIFSYVEEKKIDDKDKYRITGMTSRGGTPTVAAMEYALGRIHKQPSDSRKLLFVITDGGAGDDDSCGTKTRQLIERAKRDKVIVIACGIGSDKACVKDEFGEDHYLAIDNLNNMPLKLLDVIRRNMDGIRR